jgi:hypothetical protein
MLAGTCSARGSMPLWSEFFPVQAPATCYGRYTSGAESYPEGRLRDKLGVQRIAESVLLLKETPRQAISKR